MAERITKPGLYTSIPTADYHRDPCPSPSLSQSIAKLLIDRSPAHAWLEHPRLNPNWEPSDATKFDIGNVAHRMFTGRGREVAIIAADDWRTTAAKDARKVVLEEGRMPVLTKDYERAGALVAAVNKRLAAMGLKDDFEFGDGEAVIAWREGDIWLRTMIDWLLPGYRLSYDLKTTRASAAPQALSMRLVDAGWDVQAAMHERALDAIDPKNAGRRKFRFICVEADEPHESTVSELPESVLTMGRKKLEYAIGIWRRCMADNVWPGYPTEVLAPLYPGFKEQQWLEREMMESERAEHGVPSDILMGG
jgi:hypothetical protein